MHNISRKYSNILKSARTVKEQKKTHQKLWNEKGCAKNAKISGEIRQKNSQHDKTRAQCSAV
jgi:hypothetical protein